MKKIPGGAPLKKKEVYSVKMERPQLLRNIGEDKWEYGEQLVKSGESCVYTVETYNGWCEKTSTKWKYIVRKEQECCYRFVYSRVPGLDWQLCNKVAVL